jgi:hypothetical protein
VQRALWYTVCLSIIFALALTLSLPSALTNAKTITVVNGGGVNQPIYDNLILELTKWNRFQIVEDSEVTLVITESG